MVLGEKLKLLSICVEPLLVTIGIRNFLNNVRKMRMSLLMNSSTAGDQIANLIYYRVNFAKSGII